MFRNLVQRLRSARLWLLLQLIGLPLLLLIAIGWSRLGEKHLWQVAFSLLLPFVMIAALLVLQTGTMRRILAPLAPGHASFLHALLMLLPWIFLLFLAWHLLDICDNHIWPWAFWLNSEAPANLRARLLTFPHLSSWLSHIGWLLRWVAVPAILIPFAMASSEHGWRLHWRAALRVLIDWRWLPAVFLLALLGVALPGKFFSFNPHGTLTAQIWTVSGKIAAAYLLSLICWLLLLGWAAVLLRHKDPASSAASEEASA